MLYWGARTKPRNSTLPRRLAVRTLWAPLGVVAAEATSPARALEMHHNLKRNDVLIELRSFVVPIELTDHFQNDVPFPGIAGTDLHSGKRELPTVRPVRSLK